MRAVDLIVKKREGGELSDAEIRHLIEGCVGGAIPDYQMAAWLMAVFFRGMTFAELAALTDAMVRSGEVYDLSAVPSRKVDKHSTGGVGDKVSLVLAPLVASTGVPVPMMSGRALGHTGGTLDKLESIPGFNVRLDRRAYIDQVGRIGVAMIGQSESVAPADRKLYSLRDVTGTVESIPLITASIMSKKIAAGVNALVMDVKTGNGAFMADPDDAARLARTLVAVGREVDLPVVALLTDMNQPLGRAVGNAVEVVESIESLRGEGPDDLREIVLALGAEMLVLGEVSASRDEARQTLVACLDDGRALKTFTRMIEAQGGDPRVVEDRSVLGLDNVSEETICADRDGVVQCFDTRAVGVASMVLGAGRSTVDDAIDHAVGVHIEKKIGEPVASGEVLCRMLYNDRDRMERARALLADAVSIGEESVAAPSLVKSRIEPDSVASGGEDGDG